MTEIHKLAVHNARVRFARGWELIGHDFREALIAREVILLLLGQAGSQFDEAKDFIRGGMGWTEEFHP